MTPTLDRNRAFGTVHGDHEHGAHFVQDGFFYDATGALIEGAMDAVQVAKLAELRRQDEAIQEAKAAFLKIMPNADEATVSKLINAENLKVPTEEAELTIDDLAAWAREEKKIIFGKVTKRIRELYNISPANRLQALEILAENGVIAPRSQTPTSPSL